jgi:DNA-binding beta-propeller fold protein YncE
MRGGGRSDWAGGVSRSLRAGRPCALAWRGWRGPVVVLGVCGWLLLAGASAFGAQLHPFVSSFDGGETPAGSFLAGGVAVDNSAGPSAGAVYVEDPTGSPFPHQVVDKFASAPASGFLCQITGLAGSLAAPLTECDFEDSSRPGTPSGHFGDVVGSGVAVDPATGNVFVVDQGSNVVDEFDSSGKYLSQVTGLTFPRAVAVDRVSGVLYIAESGGEVERFDPVTSVLSTFAILGGFPGGIAVDNSGGPSAGDVYAVDAADNVVDKFDPAGTLLAQITAPGAGSFGALSGVAVDPATGDVYVADATGVVDQFDPAGALVSQISGAETAAGAMQPFGVAVSSSGLVYVSDSAHSVVDVFGAGVVVPDVVTGGASNLAPTSATVAGTVNPDGIQLTDCHFDYVDEADYDASAANPYSEGQTAPCVPAAGAIPADSSEHPVTADLTGLTPGTGYHFRLAAANANGHERGGDATFTTVVLPVIDGVSVTELSAGSATLNAKIDPKGFHATYHFEYGTSTAYGHTVPVPDGDLGSGAGDVAVSQHVSELSEDTTYHWRVVVTGANGTTTGVDHTFIYQKAGSALPDGRAYEMVTPPQKNAALIGDIFAGPPPQVSADGSRVISSMIQCLTGSESCNGLRGGSAGSPYAFTRGPAGWQVTALAPSAQTFDAVTPLRFSADAGTALFSAPRPGAEDHFYVRRADGSLVDVGPLTPPADGAQGSRLLTVGGSGDASHVVWESGFTGEHKTPAWPFDETLLGESLYQYAGFGGTQPALVAVSGGQDSHDLIGTCGARMIDRVPDGVSEDGRTVFYTVKQCPAGGSGVNKGRAVPVDELFARVGGGEAGAHTAAISEPSGLSPAEPDLGCTSEPCVKNITDSRRFREPRLTGASVDGSKAFFLSTQQLTDEASQDSNLSDNPRTPGCDVTVGAGGCNLYEYDLSNPAGHELVDVSAGDVSPRVGGVMAISPDGSHAYFVARGVLTGAANGQGQSAKDGAHNLYLFERDAGHPAGTIVFITRLAASDSPEWASPPGLANVTPDGRFLVFMSRGRMTADDTSLSGAFQVFRYDALTGSLIRLSIGEAGFNDNGNRSSATPCAGICAEDARIAPGHPFPQLGESRGDSSMSDDGSFVFFQSPVALTARALDDVQIANAGSGGAVYAQNVYEWHAGHVYLISDGRDLSIDAGQPSSCLPLNTSVCLLGADRSGANVFFSTVDQLVPQDSDTELDYYDARVCTAADPCITPPAQQTPCSSLACQATAPAAPALLTAASVSFSGPGNASPGAPAAGKVKVRARTVHGSFLLQVSVPGAGRIAISGAGLRGLRRSVAHAGTYRFAVSLTAKARAALRHRHGRRMKFRVHVTYQPPGGSSSTASLTLSVKG